MNFLQHSTKNSINNQLLNGLPVTGILLSGAIHRVRKPQDYAILLAGIFSLDRKQRITSCCF